VILPDRRGREAMPVAVHARSPRLLSEAVSASGLGSRNARFFSGADLSNLLNEAGNPQRPAGIETSIDESLPQ